MSCTFLGVKSGQALSRYEKIKQLDSLRERRQSANCSHTRGSETRPVIGRLQLEICRTATYDITVLSAASARQIWHTLAIFINKISIPPHRDHSPYLRTNQVFTSWVRNI